MEFEEGTDFCPQCGSPLMTKGKPVSGHEDMKEKEEVKLKERLICPNCKILYERMKSCVRCGAPLVKQIPSHEKDEPRPSDASEEKEREPEAAGAQEAKKEIPSIQPTVIPPTEVKRKEPKSLDISEIKKEVRKEPPSSQPPEKQPTKKLPEDMEIGLGFPKEVKKNFFQTPVGLLGTFVSVAVAIYLLFSLYSYFTRKVSEPSPSAPGETGQMTFPGTSKPTDQTTTAAEPPSPATPKSDVDEKEEIEKIEGLLDKIRQANLKENIDLFMSCYAKDFKDREERKRTTLRFWENFNYLDLSYTLKGHSIMTDTATAIVEWAIIASPGSGGPPQKSNTVLNVIFKKEEGYWKIKEIIPVK